MNITNSSLQKVDTHWAVLAIGEAERDRGLRVTEARLVKKAVGMQMQIDYQENSMDDDLLKRLSTAYEMAAIEGRSAFLNPASDAKDLREQCAAGAWRAFEIRRLFDLPAKEEERVYHILHLSALAYCGDRWSDLRRWYNENQSLFQIPSVANAQWHYRLLYRLFECWVRLFRKRRWDDLDRIREIIAGLREDQKIYESGVLDSGSNAHDRAMALRLIGLYHWAKATELLAKYMLQGEPAGIAAQLDKHFESAIDAATAGADAQQEILMLWLHAAARQMVSGSLWRVAQTVNSRATKFVREVTKQKAMFEFLPPQRAAIQEQGLLDLAATAVVVDMPTSGGKTLLSQFRMLQALNQFDAEHGWVAYVAPTRALTAQITRRLRHDFAPIGVKVEQLCGAVEIDAFEEDLLTKTENGSSFDVLVATPEKLQLIIRNKKVTRPLALVVMDEAHNIEDETRGLRIELLLATIKRECTSANFLLLMPYVEKPETLARWLAQDIHAGRAISFGTTPWKPNERIVGMYRAERILDTSDWVLKFETLTRARGSLHLAGIHTVGKKRPISISQSSATKNLSIQTAGMAKSFAEHSNGKISIATANNTDHVWSMARRIAKELPAVQQVSENIKLVQKFLATEISPRFELIDMLSHGVAVHHSGLSDEVRSLIEWLAEEEELKVLCATNTIAQGINFPVSSVFLSSLNYWDPKKHRNIVMPSRDFWNLAGRAGRIDHDSVGVVGLAAGNEPEKIVEYVSKATGELVSRLVNLLDELEKAGHLNNLETVIQHEQWEDFRCYVAHLWNEKKNLDAVLADTEQLLRNTFGYGLLRSSPTGKNKADILLDATKNYVKKLAKHPERVAFADTTGFSPEGVGLALAGLNKLERKLTASDWTPEGLFGEGSGMAELYGVMLRIPQLSESLKDIQGEGNDYQLIADITKAWVGGQTIQEIARDFFHGDENQTKAITDTCKAIYRNLANTGTWGLSALCRMSGVDFDSLSETERRRINALPAMIYHGVKTEEAVLMRMNSVPRSIAERLGEELRNNRRESADGASVQQTRDFLKQLDAVGWERVRPESAHLSGAEYKSIWELLSGERR